MFSSFRNRLCATDELSNPLVRPAILKPAYYELVLALPLQSTIATSPLPPVQPIVTAFFSALSASAGKLQNQAQLLNVAYRAFSLLISLSSVEGGSGGLATSKAEAWLDTWQAMLVWLSGRPSDSTDDSVEVIVSLAKMIVDEVMDGLAVSQNRKKVGILVYMPFEQSPTESRRYLSLQISQTVLSQDMSPLLSVWNNYEALRDTLRPLLSALFFPVPILQLSSSFTAVINAIVSRMSSSTSDLPASTSKAGMVFLPDLLSAYITALQAGRFAVFPPPASSRAEVPADVYVSAKVRAAVLAATTSALSAINDLSMTLADTSTRSTRWRATGGIWQVIQGWGGYFEGEAGWPALIAATLSEELAAIATMDADVDTQKALIATLTTCLELDYSACAEVKSGDALSALLAWMLRVRGNLELQGFESLC
jgi:uncharacterized membrane protein YvlD (DUF360 family)